MPFKPGKSGNPAGNADILRRRQQLVKKLVPMLDKVYAELEDMITDPDHREFAVKLILEYTHGKPAQSVEVSGQDGGPLIAIIKDA